MYANFQSAHLDNKCEKEFAPYSLLLALKTPPLANRLVDGKTVKSKICHWKRKKIMQLTDNDIVFSGRY